MSTRKRGEDGDLTEAATVVGGGAENADAKALHRAPHGVTGGIVLRDFESSNGTSTGKVRKLRVAPTRVATLLGCAAIAVMATSSCNKWGGYPDDQPPPPIGEIDVSKLSASVRPNASVPRGASWARESVHPIVWDIPTDLGKLDDSVTIEASQDAGATWTKLDEIVLEEQFFRWTLPSGGAPTARLRIIFHRADTSNNLIPLLRAETQDVKLGPTQKKTYKWQRVAQDAPFGPRDGAGGVSFAGKMWLIGGWNGDRFPLVCTNDVWSSVDGATWIEEKPNTFLDAKTFNYAKDWEGRHFAGYHVHAGRMWIVGGDPIQGRYQTDVWSSDNGRTWTRHDIHTVTPRLYPDGSPYPVEDFRPVEEAQYGHRTLHITGVFRNKLFVMGGQRVEQFVNPVWPGAPGKAFNDVWTSTDGASFTQVKTSEPMWQPRGFVTEVVELGGRMWLIGGGLSEDPTAGRRDREMRNDVWSTEDGSRWEEIVERPPFSPRIWHNVKSFDGRLWVINGYDGFELGRGRTADNLADVWYSTDGRNWYEASPPADFPPRHAGTSWVHNGAIFVGSGNAFGPTPGKPEVAKWYADVWKLTPAP